MKRSAFFLVLFMITIIYLNAKRNSDGLALINGNIWTVNPDQPRAEAVLVEGGVISRVGTNAEIKALISEGTSIIDLKGAFVLPGFIDCHTHFIKGGFSLSNVQLMDVKSPEEFVQRIKAKAKSLKKGEWILSGHWDHEKFNPPTLPRKEWIDGVTPDNPVLILRSDLHMGLANSPALKLAGVTKDTPVPEGGVILKDPKTGEPTGILKDTAIDLVRQHIPEPSPDEKLVAAAAALRQAAGFGVTSVHDMADYSSVIDFNVYQRLLDRGELTSRMVVYFPITRHAYFQDLLMTLPFGNDFLKIGGLKGFVDGGVGASTALFLEPYADDPDNVGILSSQMLPEGVMEERILEADLLGIPISIHAIGDKANHLLLDIVERVVRENGPRDRRFRIEHAQHLLPEDIARFAALGVVASVQPYHAIDDGRWLETRIGKQRCRTTYAFRSLLEKGTVLAFGSDWTVAPLNPLTGIHAAVTRATLNGEHPEGWIPEEKISLEDAIKGYTLNAAYAEFSDHLKGSIEEGKLADLVVLEKNLFDIRPDDIKDVKVKMTIVDGKVVYRSDQ